MSSNATSSGIRESNADRRPRVSSQETASGIIASIISTNALISKLDTNRQDYETAGRFQDAQRCVDIIAKHNNKNIKLLRQLPHVHFTEEKAQLTARHRSERRTAVALWEQHVAQVKQVIEDNSKTTAAAAAASAASAAASRPTSEELRTRITRRLATSRSALDLRRRLQLAVHQRRYHDAAKLRDELTRVEARDLNRCAAAVAEAQKRAIATEAAQQRAGDSAAGYRISNALHRVEIARDDALSRIDLRHKAAALALQRKEGVAVAKVAKIAASLAAAQHPAAPGSIVAVGCATAAVSEGLLKQMSALLGDTFAVPLVTALSPEIFTASGSPSPLHLALSSVGDGVASAPKGAPLLSGGSPLSGNDPFSPEATAAAADDRAVAEALLAPALESATRSIAERNFALSVALLHSAEAEELSLSRADAETLALVASAASAAAQRQPRSLSLQRCDDFGTGIVAEMASRAVTDSADGMPNLCHSVYRDVVEALSPRAAASAAQLLRSAPVVDDLPTLAPPPCLSASIERATRLHSEIGGTTSGHWAGVR